MPQKKEEVREYNFTDGVLSQLVDRTINNGTRDTAELDPQGVTAARLTALGDLNVLFLDMPDDEEMEGLVSEKTEDKDEAFEACETTTRNIRRMAENIFGVKSATYKRFGFDGINDLKEVNRIKAWYRIHRRATAKAAELLSEGLTVTVLSDFATACATANTAFDDVEDAVEERDNATEDRIKAGNVIYAEVVKICNTGKDYWFDKSESKYNDYVISPTGEVNGEQGYDMQTFIIPQSGSLVLADSLPEPTAEVYIRYVSGTEAIELSSSDDNNPSTPIYEFIPGALFQDFFSVLGLDPSKAQLIANNPGASDVVIRAGKKI